MFPTSSAVRDTHHIRVTVGQLRRAYKQTGAIPVCGRWEHGVHRCPLNLIFGFNHMTEAEVRFPFLCLMGFYTGWDGWDLNSRGCPTCYRLGSRLRNALNPVRIEV